MSSGFGLQLVFRQTLHFVSYPMPQVKAWVPEQAGSCDGSNAFVPLSSVEAMASCTGFHQRTLNGRISAGLSCRRSRWDCTTVTSKYAPRCTGLEGKLIHHPLPIFLNFSDISFSSGFLTCILQELRDEIFATIRSGLQLEEAIEGLTEPKSSIRMKRDRTR